MEYVWPGQALLFSNEVAAKKRMHIRCNFGSKRWSKAVGNLEEAPRQFWKSGDVSKAGRKKRPSGYYSMPDLGPIA